ncbi:AAA family ATPase [Actinopolymorpha sp. B9G3]|uniref:ATP-binding protein n=1 Tax=Actinopolymorpha sp. B9G3 TaxID=3158970 RepID=UPI0032D90948
MTDFVGRRAELAQIKELLSTARLVTLTGVAGVGKTRLGQQVAAQLADSFPDGRWVVELAPLRDDGLLGHTLTMALDVPVRSPQGPLADLIDFLHDKKLLLVVDNCEHLVGACAGVIPRLLRAAPELRVLATSRQPLGIMGEYVWPVAPLPTPSAENPLPGGADYPALTLFAQRAAAALPGFRITEENQDIVAEICRCLDGIPLAIELAAVRLPAKSLEQLLVELHTRHRWLAVEIGTVEARHHSLRAAIDGSFDLCSSAEQVMWERLSVFPTSFTLETVEQVCAGDGLNTESVLDLVAGLVDKSVLIREDRLGRAQFRLLETLRQYGQDRLREAGQEMTLRRRHRDWYLRLAEDCAAEWFGPDQVRLSSRLQAEHANIRAALDFSLTTPEETRTGLSMTATLWFYWLACGLLTEGRYWLNRALRVSPEPSRERARALWANSWIAVVQGDTAAGAAMAAECRECARQLDDRRALAHGTQVLGLSALFSNDLSRARKVFAEAGQLFAGELSRHAHESDLMCGMLLARAGSTVALTFQGDPAQAALICNECLEVCDRHGEQWVRSHVLTALALAEWESGRWREVAAHARDALRSRRTFYDLLGMAASVEMLAWIATASREFERATVLLGAAVHLWQSFGQPLFGSRIWSNPHDECETRCRGRLGDRTFEAAYHRGTELTTAQAVAYAIAE